MASTRQRLCPPPPQSVLRRLMACPLALASAIETYIRPEMQQSSCLSLAPSRAGDACCKAGRASLHAGLLSALAQIHSQPLQFLLAEGTMADLVRSIGIQPAPIPGARCSFNQCSSSAPPQEQSMKRGRRSFGSETAFFLNYSAGVADESGVKRDRYGLPAMGLWQLPQQFECLLRSLGVSLGARPARAEFAQQDRTATVGTWSGWTDVVLAAFLRRLAGSTSPRNRHYTFDVQDHVSDCISALLDHYEVTRVPNGWFGGNESWAPMGLSHRRGARSYPAVWRRPVLDFCLIDGGHSFDIASRDFRTMRSACRVIAFHDIVNQQEVGYLEQPRLWRELTSPGHKMFAREFNSSSCIQQPIGGKGSFMGIGILTRASGTQQPVNPG